VTGSIYRPGEVDDDAYGPAPTERPLPKWRPEPGEGQKQFMDWCLAMLNEVADNEQLEATIRELRADTDAESMLRDMVEEPLFETARGLMPLLTRDVFRLYRHGPPVVPTMETDFGGRPGDPKVAAARIDNARLTVLFKRHFGRHRRCKPSKAICRKLSNLTPRTSSSWTFGSRG
jgi:hypothetical protein